MNGFQHIIDDLNDAFPDHYLSHARERVTSEGVDDFQPKRAMAECIVKIAADLYDASSSLEQNLVRIQGALEEAQQHLENVQERMRRMQLEASG